MKSASRAVCGNCGARFFLDHAFNSKSIPALVCYGRHLADAPGDGFREKKMIRDQLPLLVA